ncbi:MAG TPA: gephyrin-like molybdotransferase Glp [Verrucomicrobiae bacterium]|nr:gephyrin-like molybdotransferase Glp [Verrucomicrobiae bacterium]
MIELEEAVERILGALAAPQAERMPLIEAHGRILAQPVTATVALPSFDNSAVDGYAIRAEDLKDAGASNPVPLRLIGRVAAGETFAGEIVPGTCVRLFTGSPLPRGANGVAMQEDTRTNPTEPAVVSFLDAVKPWENVRFQGEDIKPGAVIGNRGDALNAGRLSLFAASGTTEVVVARQPIVGLLATGSELLEPGQQLAPGKIFESNRLGLAALALNAGAVPKTFPLVKDTLEDTRAALEKTFAECDFVVTSGGVSVGEMDFIKSAFEAIGGKLEFWKVAIRPGRPFVFGQYREKFLFGLPGNPVSAFVTFLLLVWPAIKRFQGASNTLLPAHPGTLAEPLSNAGNRRHFVRVIVDAEGRVRSAGIQNSHVLSSLAAANGLLDMPPQTNLPAGAAVRVMRWE